MTAVAQDRPHQLYGVSEATFALAVAAAARSGESIVRTLVTAGLVADDIVADALAASTGLAVMSAEQLRDPVVVPDLNPRFLAEYSIVPLRIEAGALVVAMADPTDVASRTALSFAARLPLRVRLARFNDIADAHRMSTVMA